MLQDIIAQLTKRPEGGGYGSEVPHYNAFEQAPILANTIAQFQKEQRTAPVVEAIQRYGQQYKTAQDDSGRQAANTMANTIRANYLTGGGLPTDIPTQYWGSDPTQGFQTTTEGFQSPITGYEGLNRKDVLNLKRQALLDALSRRVQDAELTGMYNGEKTWPRQYQEGQLAASLARAASSGAGGSAGKPSDSMVSNAAYSKVANEAQNILDEWWSGFPNGPSEEEATYFMENVLSPNLWNYARQFYNAGLTDDDVKEIENRIRRASNLSPWWDNKGNMSQDILDYRKLLGQ